MLAWYEELGWRFDPPAVEAGAGAIPIREGNLMLFLLWLILAVVAWPLALLALVLYPLVWVLSIPFRLVGISLRGAFSLLEAIVRLPARVLSGPRTV
jgi:hypothetical protein